MEVLQTILKEFGVNSSFFIMLAFFVVTYFVIYHVALKGLSAYLVERDLRLEGRVKESQKLKAELAEITDKLLAEKKLAQKAASEKFSALRSKAQEEQRKILNDAKQKASTQIAEARDSLEASLQNELKKVEADLSSTTRIIIEHFLSGAKNVSSNKQLAQTEV